MSPKLQKRAIADMSNALRCAQEGRDLSDSIQTYLNDIGETEASCDAAYAVEFFELAKRSLLRARK